MAAQPDYSRLGELSPSHCGDSRVSESGNGDLALPLAMGEASPPGKVGGLDHTTILAPTGPTQTLVCSTESKNAFRRCGHGSVGGSYRDTHSPSREGEGGSQSVRSSLAG